MHRPQPRARILCPVALLALCLPALSQITTASLEGTVRDTTGAVFANAQVRVVNTATNVATSVSSDTAGRFVALSLPPGPYEVIVETTGFKRLQKTGIVLDVNQTLSLDLMMEIGATTETVEVAARATLLDSTTSEMGQVVDTRSIVNLPLNERNAWGLVFLAPGVTGASATSTTT